MPIFQERGALGRLGELGARSLPFANCIRESDTLVSTALGLAHSIPRPPSNLMDGGDGTPERRMDGPASHRSLRLGMDAEVHRPRSRFCLWRNFHPAASCDGHSRPANRAPIAMAEWPYGRLIGSIRRECLDHIVVFGERHLRHMLFLYMEYYNDARTHLSLNKDAPNITGCSGSRAYFPDTHSRRITPSVCSDLISDRDT